MRDYETSRFALGASRAPQGAGTRLFNNSECEDAVSSDLVVRQVHRLLERSLRMNLQGERERRCFRIFPVPWEGPISSLIQECRIRETSNIWLQNAWGYMVKRISAHGECLGGRRR
jgi:hypothetical protein